MTGKRNNFQNPLYLKSSNDEENVCCIKLHYFIEGLFYRMSIQVKMLSRKHYWQYVNIICCCMAWLVYVSQFQENLEHVKNLDSFSVTMGNVSAKTIYAILAMTVDITVMSWWKMVLFVIGEFLKIYFKYFLLKISF